MMQIAQKNKAKQKKNTNQSAFLTLHCIDICFNLCVAIMFIFNVFFLNIWS